MCWIALKTDPGFASKIDPPELARLWPILVSFYQFSFPFYSLLSVLIDNYILYNFDAGELYYDADGNGAGVAELFATPGARTALTETDFDIIWLE